MDSLKILLDELNDIDFSSINFSQFNDVLDEIEYESYLVAPVIDAYKKYVMRYPSHPYPKTLTGWRNMISNQFHNKIFVELSNAQLIKCMESTSVRLKALLHRLKDGEYTITTNGNVRVKIDIDTDEILRVMINEHLITVTSSKRAHISTKYFPEMTVKSNHCCDYCKLQLNFYDVDEPSKRRKLK